MTGSAGRWRAMRLFVGGLGCCHGFDGTPVVAVGVAYLRIP
ncbi:hypothetical protein ACNO8S_18530 (plasmid) [Haloarcula sp. KBTZ06]